MDLFGFGYVRPGFASLEASSIRKDTWISMISVSCLGLMSVVENRCHGVSHIIGPHGRGAW